MVISYHKMKEEGMAKTPYEYHKKAIKAYQDKLSRITLWVEPELKIRLRQEAEKEGKSLTQYIIEKVK